MKKYILLSIFSIPVMAWAQSDSIPLFLGKTCQSETFCIDSVTCNILPFKLTCEAKSRSKKLPFLTYSYQLDWDSDGKIDLKGTSSSVNLSSTNGLKLGKHKIIWRVTDVDSRYSVCEKDFEVKDCVKPQIFAKDNFVDHKLNPNFCLKTYSWTDLVDSTADNCTLDSELRYRLFKGKAESIDLDSILKLKDSINIEYAEYASFVTVFVLDQSNNWAAKVIFVSLDLQFVWHPCYRPPLASVKGTAQTDAKNGIGEVNVFINGTLTYTTGIDGYFSHLLPNDRTYNLRLRKKSQPANGVTTADLVAINKAILKVDTLLTNYRYLAADVNVDGKLSTADLIELRKVILYVQDSFTNVDSWRFVLKSYMFSKTPLKNVFPEYDIVNLDSTLNYDYIGIKMGDVNGTAKTYELQDVSDRRSPTLSYLLCDQTLLANQPFALRLPISELFQKDGFQFAIKIDPARAACLSVDGIDPDSYHFDPLTGELLVSFVKGLSTGKDISLQILPHANGRLQDFLTFPIDKLAAEYYRNGVETRFAFGFNEAEATRFAAFPNPFSSSTSLKFYAPIAQIVECNIYDLSGRLVWSRLCPAAFGWNEMQIDATELNGSGTYICQLKTFQGVFMQKLICLK